MLPVDETIEESPQMSIMAASLDLTQCDIFTTIIIKKHLCSMQQIFLRLLGHFQTLYTQSHSERKSL